MPGIGGPELWTLFLRSGRFFYKNIYLWGLPAFVLSILMLFTAIKNRKNFFEQKWRAISLLSVLMIIGYEILYFKYPLKIAYLLPLLPFALIIFGIGLKDNPKIIVLFAILLFSYNFINFNIANPDVPGQAKGASFGFSIENGYLIKDIKERLMLYKAHCDSVECSNKVHQNLL
jgi:hypothetical protein